MFESGIVRVGRGRKKEAREEEGKDGMSRETRKKKKNEVVNERRKFKKTESEENDKSTE